MDLPCSELEWNGRTGRRVVWRGISEIGLRHSMFEIPLDIQAEMLGVLLDIQVWSAEASPWLET